MFHEQLGSMASLEMHTELSLRRRRSASV